MAMTGSGMAAVVVAAIESVDPSMTNAQKAQINTAWTAICTAIVTYIQAHATVPPGIALVAGTSSGATTGTGTVQ